MPDADLHLRDGKSLSGLARFGLGFQSRLLKKANPALFIRRVQKLGSGLGRILESGPRLAVHHFAQPQSFPRKLECRVEVSWTRLYWPFQAAIA